MNSRLPNRGPQRGMSLIELMIAMTISLLVIGAVSGVYLSTSRNYTQDELLSRMQENARYAMHTLAEDLSMAGYWGPLITVDDIQTTPRSCPETNTDGELKEYCTGFYEGSSLSIAQDGNGVYCATATADEDNDSTISAEEAKKWAVTIQPPIEFASNVASSRDAQDDFNCIDDSEFFTGTNGNGTDILVVKRVVGQDLSTTNESVHTIGDIYLRTNGNKSMLFAYTTDVDASEGPSSSDWQYSPKIYYIRDHFLEDGDGIPTLVRKTLNGNVMETEAGGVAQGIEAFHVMFGVDSPADSDAIANYYTSSLDTADIDNITSARIYVMARSASPDPNYVNDKTYQLGNRTIDYSANPDNFYRRVFTTTVILRNQRNRIATSGG